MPKKKEEKKKGNYTLSEEEMAIAVQALAASEEYQIYSKMVVGQKAAEIIAAYTKNIKETEKGEEDGELPEPPQTE